MIDFNPAITLLEQAKCVLGKNHDRSAVSDREACVWW